MAVVKAVHGHEGEVTGLVQRTQFETVQDDTAGQDDWWGQDATLLLGLEGLAVARVELDDGGARVVHVVTDDESAAGCPSCGVLSTSVPSRANLVCRAVVTCGGEDVSGGVGEWVCGGVGGGRRW